MAKMIDVALL